MQFSRRHVLSSALAFAVLPAFKAGAEPAAIDISVRLAEIEASAQGRLGVAILDTRTGDLYGQRDLERFPLCSTFKVLAAALVLSGADNNEYKLDRRVTFSKKDLVPYSPITQNRAGGRGMTLAELSEAAIAHSDNTASNLLLKSFGGPEALTKWLRTLGDKATRLDRTEPALNDTTPGDPRDGTTPRAMVYTLQRILLGNVLSKASEKQLIDWMVGAQTGKARIRAGLPEGWRAGDKTGTCKGSTSDIAIIWPPQKPPIVVAAHLADSKLSAAKREAALADVGRLIAAAF